MNDLRILWLPLAVAGLAVLALLVDVLLPPSPSSSPSTRRSPIGAVVAAGLFAILVATFFVDANGSAAHGAYVAGAWSLFLQRLFLCAGIIGVLGALDDVATRTPLRQGEYWITLLFSLIGMVLLPGARDLVLLIVAFELMGIPLYILAAYAKTDAPEAHKADASEASIKLYLVGATSTAFTLFGLALFTGMAGRTRLEDLSGATLTPLGGLGLVFILAGIGYKIGMAPFHMWVPDTYQGARAPFVAFLSVAPKAAGVAVLVQIFLFGMGERQGAWLPVLGAAAIVSMAVGNVLALPQTDLRRLLGYSGIAQMGYVLVGVLTNDRFGIGMVLFFLAAYVVTNMGAFLVVHACGEQKGDFSIGSLSGLARRSPGMAAALLCFVLSLAGIPFVIGFWAKLYVLLAAWRAGLYGLVAAAVILAVLGLFYYLRLLRSAYMTDDPTLTAPKMGGALRLAIGICLAGVVGLGLWPSPLVDASAHASASLFDVTPPAVAIAEPHAR